MASNTQSNDNVIDTKSMSNLCRIYVESMSSGCRTPRVIPVVALSMCPYVGHRVNTCTTVKFVLRCDCTNPLLPLARMRQLYRSHTPICAHMVIESNADAPIKRQSHASTKRLESISLHCFQDDQMSYNNKNSSGCLQTKRKHTHMCHHWYHMWCSTNIRH